MRFLSTPLQDVFLIDLEPISDDRGFFSRFFCLDEFQKKGLEHHFAQGNVSFSKEKGTLRGLHYQLPPSEEVKLVRCTQGSFYDVVLDLRKNSSTYGRSFGETLSAENRRMMYVPKGCAHGFLTLEEKTEVSYLVSSPYSKELERGVRWDDPAFEIAWPFPPKVLSDRDRNHLDFIP